MVLLFVLKGSVHSVTSKTVTTRLATYMNTGDIPSFTFGTSTYSPNFYIVFSCPLFSINVINILLNLISYPYLYIQIQFFKNRVRKHIHKYVHTLLLTHSHIYFCSKRILVFRFEIDDQANCKHTTTQAEICSEH